MVRKSIFTQFQEFTIDEIKQAALLPRLKFFSILFENIEDDEIQPSIIKVLLTTAEKVKKGAQWNDLRDLLMKHCVENKQALLDRVR